MLNIIMGIVLLFQFVLVVYCGYRRANEKANHDEPNASVWETLERTCVGVLCVMFLYILLCNDFDTVTWNLKEIMKKVEELAY